MINSSDLTLSAIGTDIKRKSADTLVLGVLKNDGKATIVASPFTSETTSSLEQSLTTLGASGKADEATLLPGVEGSKAKVLLFIGLGVEELAELTEEKLRRAAGSAARQLTNTKTAIFVLPSETVERVAAIAEGIALGSYRYENHRSKKSDKPVLAEAQIATSVATSKDLPAVLKRAAVLGRAVRGTRDLINAPANVLYPESFATAVKDYSKSLPLKVTVFDEKRLAKDGFGGLIGVGGGSVRQPRMVKVEYSPLRQPSTLR